MESHRLSPAPAAAPEQLLRRVWLDLTGLPPTPDEFDALAHDAAADWYERVVDRLLSSPQYANVGPGTGWTWRAMARATASNTTWLAPTPGATATMSSPPSTKTSLTTDSCWNRIAGDETLAGPAGGVNCDRVNLSVRTWWIRPIKSSGALTRSMT